MSIYDIDTLFSYVIPTSSLDYVRNYNFNTTTVSSLPLTLINSGSEIPITINITTTVPWIQVTDPSTGANLKYPSGNVVLPPTSSKLVYIKVDLPPEIEAVTETTVRPNIILDAITGSFLIIRSTTNTTGSATGSTASGSQSSKIQISTYDVTLRVGEKQLVEFTIYNNKGEPVRKVVPGKANKRLLPTSTELQQKVTAGDLSINSANKSIATVKRILTKVPYEYIYSPIEITGKSAGETTVEIKYRDEKSTIKVTVAPAEPIEETDEETNTQSNTE
jgi:hypothetical protein